MCEICYFVGEIRVLVSKYKKYTTFLSIVFRNKRLVRKFNFFIIIING